MSRVSILLLLAWAIAASGTSFPEATLQYREDLWDKSCRNQTYCYVPSSEYPMETIEAILQRMANNKELMKEHGIINYRSDIDEDFVQKCLLESNEDATPIYEIIDINGTVRYVVQSDKYFTQTIKLIKCKNPDSTIESTDYYELYCKEKRIDYKLMVLSNNGDDFEFVSMPSRDLDDLTVSKHSVPRPALPSPKKEKQLNQLLYRRKIKSANRLKKLRAARESNQHYLKRWSFRKHYNRAKM
ncbi:hypothetical protein K1T71_005765 [Dendrolimus kikuchii]|uniref:Uncharacterized protein n=1 Tax=Dendrolimus kikuchii TaxID=765133 RepID=A0ACC1D5A4_9NEOP|nr:hypothetical protein K1T71_005765 [Dendrolimus kikuchii]